MHKLLKYELSSLFKQRRFTVFMIVFLLLGGFFGAMNLQPDSTGSAIFLTGFSSMAQLLTMGAPVFVGLFFGQNFQSRHVSETVMAGKSRIQIVLSKYIVFFVTMTVLMVLGAAFGGLIATVFKGWGSELAGPQAGELIFALVQFVLLTVLAFSLCLVIVFAFQSVGASIGIGILALTSYSILLQTLIDHKIFGPILLATPLGRGITVMGEQATGGFPVTAVILVGFLLLHILLSWLIFRSKELK